MAGALRRGWPGAVFRLCLIRLVEAQEVLQAPNGIAKAIAEGEQEVDVVDVLPTAKTVGQVVAGIHDGLEIAAMRADETETALDGLGVGRFVTQLLEGERHRQVVAQAA